MKRLLLVWMMILCMVLSICAAASAESSSYGIKSKTWILTFTEEKAETGSEDYISQDAYRIEYNESGLAVAYSTLMKNRTPFAIYTYKDGEVVFTEDLRDLPEELAGPAERLIGPDDPLNDYELAYAFDDYGNPTKVQLLSEGNIAKEYSFVNQYEGEQVVSVTTDPPFAVDDAFPLYELVGHFAGYKDAMLIFGITHYQNQDGFLAVTETSLDWESEDLYITRNEYDHGRMIKTATVYTIGSNSGSFSHLFDSIGKPNAMVLTEGDQSLTASVHYENGVDDQGRDCLIGTFALDDYQGISPEAINIPFDRMSVYCYLDERGAMTELVTNGGLSEQTIEKYDERGSMVYQERLIGVADQHGNVYQYSHSIEETSYEYR